VNLMVMPWIRIR